MILTRTPFRISFFGGGTDYPDWYLKEGGAVLSTTIDKYCYISCRFWPPFFEARHRVVWSHIETVSTISEILHPAVREGLKFLGFDDSIGIEIHHQGDLPARAGMGSSSSFAVGLIKALTALRGETLSKYELALKAIDLEQNCLKEKVGSQDQIAAAYGGFNVIRFLSDGGFIVDPIIISSAKLLALQERILLFYTGSSRLSSSITADVIENFNSKHNYLKNMVSMVEDAITILNEGNLDDFGKMLHRTWEIKRTLSHKISNSHIDKIYDIARSQGALGGKLLGAGGAGFMIFYVPVERQSTFIDILSNHCLHVPFKFESGGSKSIYDGLPDLINNNDEIESAVA